MTISSNYSLIVNKAAADFFKGAAVKNKQLTRVAPLCFLGAGLVHMVLGVTAVVEAILHGLVEVPYVALALKKGDVKQRAVEHIKNAAKAAITFGGGLVEVFGAIGSVLSYIRYHDMKAINSKTAQASFAHMTSELDAGLAGIKLTEYADKNDADSE